MRDAPWTGSTLVISWYTWCTRERRVDREGEVKLMVGVIGRLDEGRTRGSLEELRKCPESEGIFRAS